MPAGTQLILPPSLHAMAAAGDSLGLRTFVLPDPQPCSLAAGAVPFLTAPGFVNFTAGSTGLRKPVDIVTRGFLVQTAAIIETCQLDADSPVAGALRLATHYGLGHTLFLPTVLGSPGARRPPG